MRTVGIICEYDPFHKGHEYLVEQARTLGDTVVCVMSGNVTQRGGFAIVDRYVRAEAAVRCGVDLVLELPYPYSSASAEFFASAGVSVLASVGASRICFGSECGDISRLMRAANVSRTLALPTDREQGTAEGYFSALSKAYEDAYGEPFCPDSNDILGIEYCKAILAEGYDIEPVAIKRLGDGFRAETAGDSSYASATAIRRLIREGGIDAAEPLIPAETACLLRDAMARGDAPVDEKRLEGAILAFFRLADADVLSSFAELGGGLAYRLCEAARETTTLAAFFARAATKKYTDARIRRAVLYAMTGVTADDLRAPVGYTTVLAANSVGCELLASLRKREEKIPILTKPADGQKTAPRQYALSLAADALFAIATPQARTAGEWIRKMPVIL